MSSTHLETGEASPQHVSSHTISSLLRRAVLGLAILVVSTVLLAWLYDAGIAPSAQATVQEVADRHDVSKP